MIIGQFSSGHSFLSVGFLHFWVPCYMSGHKCSLLRSDAEGLQTLAISVVAANVQSFSKLGPGRVRWETWAREQLEAKQSCSVVSSLIEGNKCDSTALPGGCNFPGYKSLIYMALQPPHCFKTSNAFLLKFPQCLL